MGKFGGSDGVVYLCTIVNNKTKQTMKNLTPAQIAQVRHIKYYFITSFHGNTKKVGTLPIGVYKEIVRIKLMRKYTYQTNAVNFRAMTDTQKVRHLLRLERETGSMYYKKILIEGDTGIYYASPVFGHKDYNKMRVFDKNEKTLKLMRVFNALVGAKNYGKHFTITSDCGDIALATR